MDLFPMNLTQTTLAKWGSCVVPQGKHKGKTFADVAVESGSNYRGRECRSFWARSLCAYAYEMEIDGKAWWESADGHDHLDNLGKQCGNHSDKHGGYDVGTKHDADADDGQDYETHGGGNGVKAKHDKVNGIDYDTHGGGYGVNTHHDKDDGMDCDTHGGGYAVDGRDNDMGLRTIILKVPHDAKVTVQMP